MKWCFREGAMISRHHRRLLSHSRVDPTTSSHPQTAQRRERIEILSAMGYHPHWTHLGGRIAMDIKCNSTPICRLRPPRTLTRTMVSICLSKRLWLNRPVSSAVYFKESWSTISLSRSIQEMKKSLFLLNSLEGEF